MNIVLGVTCLVAVAVLVGVTGTSEQHVDTENLDLYGSRVDIQARYGACKRGLGGKCVKSGKNCPTRFPLETKRGSPYCNNRRRCCYPETITEVTTNEDVQIGGDITNSCMNIVLENGNYTYTGGINTNCGECEVWGDPHFITFDNTRGVYYSFQGLGIFKVTQMGLKEPAMVKVITELQNVPDTGYSSPRSVCYIQYLATEQIEVCIILPPFTDTHCFTSANPAILPDCKMRVKINNQFVNIGESISQFGTVLVFDHNHIAIRGGVNLDDTSCMNIVATSTGLSMCLCLSDHTYFYSNLFIWAMPHLKTQLYGMCNTYTGTPHDVYTMQDGKTTTDVTNFAASWQIYGAYSTVPDVETCTNNPVKSNLVRSRCTEVTDDACQYIEPGKCSAFNESCVYDLCRVSNVEKYAQAYAGHMSIESHLNQ